MANPTPGDGGSETVEVTSNQPNAPIGVTARYRTTTSSYAGTTDGSGSGSVTFGIGRPTIGYTVRVNVTAGQATCATAFTPQG
jgi:hypothetical protein